MYSFFTHFGCFVLGCAVMAVVIGLLKSNGRDDDDLEGTFDERMESKDRPVRILGLDPRWERINQAFKETEIAE
jgi:hypothetical protein